MNLKTLALLVCIAQVTQLAVGIYFAVTKHYYSAQFALQNVLSLPLVLFFFYVWKHQKAKA